MVGTAAAGARGGRAEAGGVDRRRHCLRCGSPRPRRPATARGARAQSTAAPTGAAAAAPGRPLSADPVRNLAQFRSHARAPAIAVLDLSACLVHHSIFKAENLLTSECHCAGSEPTTAEGLRALQAQVAATRIGVPELDALDSAVTTLEDFQVPMPHTLDLGITPCPAPPLTGLCLGVTEVSVLRPYDGPSWCIRTMRARGRRRKRAAIAVMCWAVQARCRELNAALRPSLADLESLCAEAEDLPGVVPEMEPLYM